MQAKHNRLCAKKNKKTTENDMERRKERERERKRVKKRIGKRTKAVPVVTDAKENNYYI